MCRETEPGFQKLGGSGVGSQLSHFIWDVGEVACHRCTPHAAPGK